MLTSYSPPGICKKCGSLANVLFPISKRNYYSARRFIDSLRIHVTGGQGGQGSPQRGGNGGRGGDIILEGAKDEMLRDIVKSNPGKRFKGEAGSDSQLFVLNGAPGKNTKIKIPLGTTVLSSAGACLGEINLDGQKLIVAKGGSGGNPVNGFAGQKGQAHVVTLDLKLIADVGFVGFPNAGKSTLLRALSRARPKVADYPFTTISPNVGIIEYPDRRKISLADLPGLIEGAHANIGMGHKFLKHVERTRLLLFIVDIFGFKLGLQYPMRSALETIAFLNRELELYRPDLCEKPALLVLNKCDLPNSYSRVEKIKDVISSPKAYDDFIKTLPEEFQPREIVRFHQIVPTSAAHDVNSIIALKNCIRKTIDSYHNYDRILNEKEQELQGF